MKYRVVWAGSRRGSPVTSYPYPTVGLEDERGNLYSLGTQCLYSPARADERPALLDAPRPETCDGPGYYDLFVLLPDGWYRVNRDAGTGAVYGVERHDGPDPVRHLYYVPTMGWAPLDYWRSKGLEMEVQTHAS